MSILAIDQGTSATKAVVVCPDRGLLAEVDVPVSGLVTAGGAVEQDPAALLTSVLEAGARALARAGEQVEAVAVGNQGETVLAWNPGTGAPSGPAISWQDRRASTVTDRLRAQGHAGRLQQLTGLPLDPYFAAPKMAYLRDELGLAGGVLSTIDAWVLHALTGRSVTDASTASRTMLLDLGSVTWSQEACAAFGLDSRDLPEIVACDAAIGSTDAFGARVDVVGAMVDQQAALLAQGCTMAGDAKCTYGTGAFLLATLGPQPIVSAAGLSTSVAWQLAGAGTTYCVDGQVYSVGSAVRWLEGLGLISDPGDLDRLGGSVASSDGVVFLPGLAGLGAPLWLPDARGAFTGLTLSTTRAHLVRSFVEGVAAQVTLLVRAVEQDLGRPLTSLKVDGGLTRSALLMQEQADQLGVPIEVYPGENATAMGVAAAGLRGRYGAGAEESVLRGWRPSARYEPASDRAAALDRFARWEHALLTGTQ